MRRRGRKRSWTENRRELLIVALVVVAIGVFIYLGLQVQQRYFGEGRESQGEGPGERITIQEPRSQPSGGAGGQGQEGEQGGESSFFLRPSADEIMAMLAKVDVREMGVDQERYRQLRVMWPVYFFAVIEQDSLTATIVCDTSDTGFGVAVQGLVDLQKFPEVVLLERGTRLWLAGEILAVDPSGTGTVHLRVEHVRYGEGPLVEEATDTGK